MGRHLFGVLAGAAFGASALAVAANAAIIGAPEPGHIGFLPANSPIQYDIEWFHNAILLPVTIGISLFWCSGCSAMSFSASTSKPTRRPRGQTHNGPLEIAWTVIPALILVVIAVPSFRLLSDQLIIPAPDMTLKVTASQWHWNYGYPKSEGGFSFDSIIKEDKDLKPGDIRLLYGRQRSLCAGRKDR